MLQSSTPLKHRSNAEGCRFFQNLPAKSPAGYAWLRASETRSTDQPASRPNSPLMKTFPRTGRGIYRRRAETEDGPEHRPPRKRRRTAKRLSALRSRPLGRRSGRFPNRCPILRPGQIHGNETCRLVRRDRARKNPGRPLDNKSSFRDGCLSSPLLGGCLGSPLIGVAGQFCVLSSSRNRFSLTRNLRKMSATYANNAVSSCSNAGSLPAT